ncbi:MAG: hypothetical protein K2N73_03745 [Lachnospiraceae bacterium]|nr:hypothetical protein [Lachnospiraceae bacterium]
MVRSSRRFMAVIIMFIILTSVWIIIYLPPYEKLTYSKSRILGYREIEKESYGFEGYRGGEDIPLFDSSDVSKSIRNDHDDFFRLKINVANLKPMGVYRPAAYDTSYTAYETNALKVMFLRTKESYAQYYMVSFANGEQMPVLVNDRVVKIPHSGEVILPIGRIRMDSNLKKVSNENLTDEKYINASTGFAASHEMRKFHDIRTMSAAGLMIAAFIGVIIWMVSVQMRRR